MKLFAKSLVVIGMIVLAVAGLDHLRSTSIQRKARTIKVGDSKQQVERALGEADTIFDPSSFSAQVTTNFWAAFLSVQSETWAYGSRLDLRHAFQSEFPYFYPFRFRLFAPDADDVAIEFNSSGKVTKVNIP
jgi:hypothetical protein